MPEQKRLLLTKKDDITQLFPHPPILTSLDTSWHGIVLGYFREPAYEAPEVSSPFWHSILVLPKTETRINALRTLDGCRKHDSAVEGDIIITPATVGHRSCWDAEHDFMVIGIQPDVFARAIDESREPEEIKLLPHFATPDPLVLQIGLALKRVLENDASGSRLYALDNGKCFGSSFIAKLLSTKTNPA